MAARQQGSAQGACEVAPPHDPVEAGPAQGPPAAFQRAGISVLLGVFVFGEQPTPSPCAGLAAIILGVAAIKFRRASA